MSRALSHDRAYPTLHPRSCTRDPAPATLHPRPCTLDPAPATLDPARANLQAHSPTQQPNRAHHPPDPEPASWPHSLAPHSIALIRSRRLHAPLTPPCAPPRSCLTPIELAPARPTLPPIPTGWHAAAPAPALAHGRTSGLDGAATVQLAQCLSQLRTSGLSIICVIHQPRYSVFKTFTHLMLLGAGGRQVYGGLAGGVHSYLSQEGFRMPEGENVADWMIDVVSGLELRYAADGSVDREYHTPLDLFLRWEAVRQAAREARQSQRSRAAAPNDNGRRAGGGLLAKEDCTTDWDLGFEAPEAVRTGERPVLVPRDGLGRMKQTYYLMGRSLRQHSSSFFLAVCLVYAPEARPATMRTHAHVERSEAGAGGRVTLGRVTLGRVTLYRGTPACRPCCWRRRPPRRVGHRKLWQCSHMASRVHVAVTACGRDCMWP